MRKICYVFKIKAGRFGKRYLSCNRFARKYFVRARCLEKLCSLFINRAFVTDVREFQALLDACSSAQEWQMLMDYVLIPDEWMTMAYARLTELTVQELEVSGNILLFGFV